VPVGQLATLILSQMSFSLGAVDYLIVICLKYLFIHKFCVNKLFLVKNGQGPT